MPDAVLGQHRQLWRHLNDALNAAGPAVPGEVIAVRKQGLLKLGRPLSRSCANGGSNGTIPGLAALATIISEAQRSA
jgi:hypothetical protein